MTGRPEEPPATSRVGCRFLRSERSRRLEEPTA